MRYKVYIYTHIYMYTVYIHIDTYIKIKRQFLIERRYLYQNILFDGLIMCNQQHHNQDKV